MAVNFNFKKGTDKPIKDWLPFFPQGPSYHGTACAYDGSHYIYWIIQYGTTGTSASTTQLWRFDVKDSYTWQYLATPTSGNRGMDLEYDSVRNVLYMIHGGALNSWQVFNLNTTAVTIANQSCAAWALTTITTVLPAITDYGASLTMPCDTDVPDIIDTGACTAASTTTSLVDSASGKSAGTFGSGMVGLYAEFTSGALLGQRRLITAVPSPTTLTVTAFGSAPAAGDTFKVILPIGTASSGSVNTLVMTGAGWTTNFYANSDVVILSGTGAGQRRRIASNTIDTLTLAGAVTGNARTGNWTVTPDATSVFEIVPSSDFLYYQPGSTSNTIYRIDLVQTTGTAWSANLGAAPGAPSGGANTMYAKAYDPFAILMARGNSTANIYRFGIGTSAWTTLTTFAGSETFTTGTSVAMLHGKRKILFQKDSATRVYALDLTTGILEPFFTMPYAAPGAYDGKRVRYITDQNGIGWVYILRAGGQEFFRVPVEWLD